MIDFDRLDNALQSATTPVPALFRAVMDCGGGRLSLLRRSGKCSVIDHLIASGAWTDAALALIQLGMPAWIVRRLAYEDSEWHCSLSRHPNVPIALDDMAEARHEILALAILRALVGAARRGTASARPISAVPEVRPVPDQIICCDNFA